MTNNSFWGMVMYQVSTVNSRCTKCMFCKCPSYMAVKWHNAWSLHEGLEVCWHLYLGSVNWAPLENTRAKATIKSPNKAETLLFVRYNINHMQTNYHAVLLSVQPYVTRRHNFIFAICLNAHVLQFGNWSFWHHVLHLLNTICMSNDCNLSCHFYRWMTLRQSFRIEGNYLMHQLRAF